MASTANFNEMGCHIVWQAREREAEGKPMCILVMHITSHISVGTWIAIASVGTSHGGTSHPI
jgi:hypothetical protein